MASQAEALRMLEKWAQTSANSISGTIGSILATGSDLGFPPDETGVVVEFKDFIIDKAPVLGGVSIADRSGRCKIWIPVLQSLDCNWEEAVDASGAQRLCMRLALSDGKKCRLYGPVVRSS